MFCSSKTGEKMDEVEKVSDEWIMGGRGENGADRSGPARGRSMGELRKYTKVKKRSEERRCKRDAD